MALSNADLRSISVSSCDKSAQLATIAVVSPIPLNLFYINGGTETSL